MARVNVYSSDPYGPRTLEGWFNDASLTEEVREETRWNGNNHIGVISGLQCGYEELLRTARGRWVRHYDGRREFNGPEYYEFMTDDQARDWLLRNEGSEDAEAVLKRYFGEPEEESGPNLGGRPQVGPKVETRLDEDTLKQVDARAEQEGVSRAEMLRRLVVAAL